MNVSVATVIFTVREAALHVLLAQRRAAPARGAWAIPEGFVGARESLEGAASRGLAEETGVSDVYLEQLYTFGARRGDPRGRVLTVAYFALIASSPTADGGALATAPGAASARWWPMHDLPPHLAFDHAAILAYALERLRNKLEYTTVGFQLLPEKFTLSELQQVYEAILGRRLDKRNFRRKIELLGIVDPLDEHRRGTGSRPAQLYRFSARRFEKLKDRGILFPF